MPAFFLLGKFMKKCIAYERAHPLPNAWCSCRKVAAPGSVFCRRHGDAVDGAVLGMLVHGYGLDENGVSAKRSTAPGAVSRRNGNAAAPGVSAVNKLHD
jgi:hypothetical protein